MQEILKKIDDHLKTKATSKKKAAQFLSIYPAIEQRLKEGYTHAELKEALNSVGFELSLATFRGNLYRARKKFAAHQTESKEQITPAKREMPAEAQGNLNWQDYMNRKIE